MTTRSYREAIDCLNGLQSNQAMIEASRASGGRMVQFAMHETEEYLGRIGYKVCYFYGQFEACLYSLSRKILIN